MNARDVIKHIVGALPNYLALVDLALQKMDLDQSEQIAVAEA